MKVLFVSDNAKLSNPFVETLIAGLYEFNLNSYLIDRLI